MKLDEIRRIPSNPFAIKQTKPNTVDLQKVGTFDRLDILQGTVEGHPNLFCLEIEKGSAFLVYRIIELYGIKYANILRVWIREQNKGWGSRLYDFILKELKLPILSDEEHTPESEKLYRSLIKKKSSKILDITSGETFDAKTFDLSKVYSKNDEPTDYRIVLCERRPIIPDLPRNLREQMQYIIFVDGDF